MAIAARKIKLRAPGGISIEWSDGHQSVYPYAYLRGSCPCAVCREKPPRLVGEDDPFRIVGQDPIRPTGAQPVGRYAIQFSWNDSHSSGIYTLEYLRRLCPCEACSKPESASKP